MSSSIQKVLNQRKKTPQEIEREKYENQQATHIQKALISHESAPKEKHIRGIILGTFTDRGASFFYREANKLQLQGHPITCWKFFYTVNKLIRNGHPYCLRDTMKCVSLISELGRLWGHLKQGYGPPIAAFAKLIIQKLRFHKKHLKIPGNLTIGTEDLSEIVGNNVNNLFEVSVDLLDYMEELMAFQEVVLSSMDKSRSNSMTQQGQCKLTPLIQCVQDAATLYDCLVKLLFRLHSGLPGDTLIGHRERFFKQYRSLQTFFQTAQTLQYFKNLIQVPNLPEFPPNFLVESELASHRAPEVKVSLDDSGDDVTEASGSPEEAPISSLIDVAEPIMIAELPQRNDRFDTVFGNDMGDFSFNGVVHDSNGPRHDLMAEIDRLNAEMSRMIIEHKEKMEAFLTRIKTLEENVKSLVQLKERYEEEIEELKTHKLQNVDQGKVYEEKFRKMRDIYSKLRDEHVDLLRKKAAISKELDLEKKKTEEKEEELRAKCNEVAHMEHERLAASQVQGHSTAEELTEAKTRLMDVERSRKELETQLNSLTVSRKEAVDKNSILEARVNDLEQEKVLSSETVQSMESRLSQMTADLEASNQRAARSESQLAEMTSRCAELEPIKGELERLRRCLLTTSCQRGAVQIKEAVDFFDSPELMSCKGSAEFFLSRIDVVLNEVETIEGICSEYATNTNDQGSLSPVNKSTPKVYPSLFSAELIDQLVCSIGQFSSRLSECLLQGKATSNSAPSVQQADDLVSACRLTSEEGLNFLHHLGEEVWESETVLGHASSLLAHLKAVQALGEQMRPQMKDVRPEEIGDLIDQEMKSTSEAIEAAEIRFQKLLEKSRADMSGVQLEVNERILDSCNQLMNAIKVLVEKSKVLQREIIAEGRGTSSAGEFYKKHHRWTEGLISAAKAVGFGATTLCDSADKLLSGEGSSFEELMVSSQDIAASTAQLVVASRVKANPKSFSLQQLQTASKEVAVATGNVVASTKSAAQFHDQQDDLDFNHLSLTQSKRMEIDSQVRVLQLETDIEKERKRLGELRKRHYQLASESEQLDPEESG